MQRRPDLVTVLVLIFGLGVVFTGVSASQPKSIEIPVMGQMQGLSINQSANKFLSDFN